MFATLSGTESVVEEIEDRDRPQPAAAELGRGIGPPAKRRGPGGGRGAGATRPADTGRRPEATLEGASARSQENAEPAAVLRSASHAASSICRFGPQSGA